jgi:D-serine deaminase-like pyridoxal phosphate-dependent protein
VTTLHDLPTPCLVLDKARLERNLTLMSDRMRRRGVALRPHLKTAKSGEVARMATANEAGGITVSTLAEAEYFVERGFRDVLIAAAQAPSKLDRAGRLTEKGATVTLVADHPDLARSIAEHPAPFRALVEIDSGDHRAGVDAGSGEVLAIARAMGDKLAGVMTHAGHSYDCRDIPSIRAVAENERQAVVLAASQLRSGGLRCEVVSVGSTPTMTHAEDLSGVTEGRPGVYMFQDLFQAAIGSCTKDDIAVTVLASVIGVDDEEGRFLVDAGALALSKDRSTQATARDAGYGEVWGLGGEPLEGGWTIARAWQEHGMATPANGGARPPLPIGGRVRIGPNHACITAAAHDRYYVVDGGVEVVGTWDRVNGW